MELPHLYEKDFEVYGPTSVKIPHVMRSCFFVWNMNHIIIHFSKQTHAYTCLKEIKGQWRLKLTAGQQQMSSHFQMENARYDVNKEKLLFSIKILRTISLSLEISWTGKYQNLRDSFGTILIGSLAEFGLNRGSKPNSVHFEDQMVKSVIKLKK